MSHNSLTSRQQDSAAGLAGRRRSGHPDPAVTIPNALTSRIIPVNDASPRDREEMWHLFRRFYAGTHRGVFKSTTAGTSWTAVRLVPLRQEPDATE